MDCDAPVSTNATTARVLVVDDNLDTATSAALLLSLQGYETFMAHDGLAAIAAAEEKRPDVVLLDIGLPKLDGFEVAKRIREMPWGRDVVLIAHTGLSDQEAYDKCVDSGFNFQLVKPVTAKTLASVLSNLTFPSIPR